MCWLFRPSVQPVTSLAFTCTVECCILASRGSWCWHSCHHLAQPQLSHTLVVQQPGPERSSCLVLHQLWLMHTAVAAAWPVEALGYNSATLKALSAASPTPRSYQPSRQLMAGYSSLSPASSPCRFNSKQQRGARLGH